MPMTINGSGTITGLSAGGLPDATIQQADLATGVAGTGPAFIAYASVAQSIPHNTFTKIQINTEEYDTANCFDSATNYRFTPNVAGFYQLSGGAQMSANGGTAVAIYKNGAEILRGSFPNSSTVGISSTVSGLVYLNGTADYAELFALQASGGALNTAVSLRSLTYFQGFLARAA